MLRENHNKKINVCQLHNTLLEAMLQVVFW